MFELITKYEHFDGDIEDVQLPKRQYYEHCFPKKRDPENARCYIIRPTTNGHNLKLSYFIGVDWIIRNEKAIYVEPKLNGYSPLTNYLAMLMNALKHPDISTYSDDLFEIKFEEPFIEIEQHRDLITPLIIIQFLSVIQSIVRKGLKKSFYKVEHNLSGRIKGKILQGETIRKNLFRHKPLNTFCRYEEFGYDGFENRLLKKALLFVARYLPGLKIQGLDAYALKLLNYTMPTFSDISEDVDFNLVKQNIPNVLYREYTDAMRLATFILKRFGFNIANAQQSGKVKTPPFWIDMSKLFELYVLGLLKDSLGKDIVYQFNANYGNPDFLLLSEKMVADAKYVPKYRDARYEIENIRQISGYARDRKVITKLKANELTAPDCLIIYPDQDCGYSSLKEVNLKAVTIDQFVNFFKVPVRLPVIQKTPHD
jgi:5-methylcytosine-specific restriction enzyme subunit McrC